jgi:threonine dehydrogenase-like Zn-dependent dehydrogenase
MVTRRFPLDEAPDAYAAARQTGENIKVHIESRSTQNGGTR